MNVVHFHWQKCVPITAVFDFPQHSVKMFLTFCTNFSVMFYFQSASLIRCIIIWTKIEMSTSFSSLTDCGCIDSAVLCHIVTTFECVCTILYLLCHLNSAWKWDTLDKRLTEVNLSAFARQVKSTHLMQIQHICTPALWHRKPVSIITLSIKTKHSFCIKFSILVRTWETQVYLWINPYTQYVLSLLKEGGVIQRFVLVKIWWYEAGHRASNTLSYCKQVSIYNLSAVSNVCSLLVSVDVFILEWKLPSCWYVGAEISSHCNRTEKDEKT